MEKHTLQSLLWTGLAVKRFAYPAEVSDAVMRDPAGLIIPAVATDPFKYVQQLLSLLLQMTQDKEGEYPRLLSNSLMVKWDAKTVPLQPVVAKMHSSLRPAVLAGNDRMANFYPLGMSRENIGSNVGLSRIMRKIHRLEDERAQLRAIHGLERGREHLRPHSEGMWMTHITLDHTPSRRCSMIGVMAEGG